MRQPDHGVVPAASSRTAAAVAAKSDATSNGPTAKESPAVDAAASTTAATANSAGPTANVTHLATSVARRDQQANPRRPGQRIQHQ
jgi:hypothetical protein